MVRDRMTREVFVRIVDALGVEDAEFRPSPAASPLAPNLQRYMVGPLPETQP